MLGYCRVDCNHAINQLFFFWRPFIDSGGAHLLEYTNTFILSSALTFFLPAMFWMVLKEKFIKAYLSVRYKQEIYRFKYNGNVFNSLLNQQKLIIPTDGLGIILGDEHSKKIIITVSNPYCGACSEAHPIINDILEKNKDIKVQIIFSGHSRYDNDMGTVPVKHFMALYEKDKIMAKGALDYWHNLEVKNYEDFTKKYRPDDLLNQQQEKLIEMKDWCEKMGITHTPTFFINGRQLPKFYTMEDLQYIL